MQRQDDKPKYLLEHVVEYLKTISRITGRNTIAYYSGWMKNNNPETQILETDKNAFMNAVYQMDRAKGLNLILHTPGGDIAATEGIVDYLQSLFDGKVHAIVPQISMSAGTMMAISCKDILMGRQSSLGPIDPQIGGIACQMVVSEFYQAANEIKQEPSRLGLWKEIIGKYPVAFMTTCTDAIKWSEELAEKWLRNVNPDIDIDIFKNTFINHSHSYSHSRRIQRSECRKAGLQIQDLEDNQDLQEAVLSLHHCLMILMDIAPILKFVTNQEGRYIFRPRVKRKNDFLESLTCLRLRRPLPNVKKRRRVLIFSTIFFAVPLFLPIFANGNKTMVVHPGEQRLLLGHQGRAFFMPAKNVSNYSQKILAVAIP